MKTIFIYSAICLFVIGCAGSAGEKKTKEADSSAQPNVKQTAYYIDVHDLEPGKVSFADVAGAHEKDLATQGKFEVNFIKYWVDEQKGKVYCLSKAADEQSVTNTHKEAHGLLPSMVYKVTDGPEAAMAGDKPLYIDVHQLGPGTVTAKDVAGAHEKDLAVQKNYGVNFINYWVDEKQGVILCLSEAADSSAVKNAHKEAHGLLPTYVMQVKQGQ
jgi:hypothetical protein